MTKITVENIAKICSSKLSEKTSDANASSRLQKELDYISKYEAYAEVFTVASELASYSRELGYYTTFHGDIGSSLVAFLLGITEIDPLKYNLPVEIFTGIHNDKPLYIALRFDSRFIPMVKRYVRENYPNITIMPCSPQQMMALIKRGDIPRHFTERKIYDDKSHWKKADKNSFYLESHSVIINFYWKYAKQKKKHPNYANREESYSVIRFEVQCKYPKLYALAKKHQTKF